MNYDTKEAVIADGVHGELAPPEIVQMTGSIHEHKGKQELFYVSDSICKPEQESLVAKGASVQEITYNSEVVSEEAGNVLTSIETLQETMGGISGLIVKALL